MFDFGWDHELNRPLAIKRIKSWEDATHGRVMEKALNEARALPLLLHPHVLKLDNSSMDESGPYFIMEHSEDYTRLHKIDSGAPRWNLRELHLTQSL